MSRIIKTVSLDPESDEIASRKKNFSAWVRKALKEEASLVDYRHVTRAIFEKRGICNPSASPRCGICYPYGKPDIKLIQKYNNEISTISGISDLSLAAANLQKATMDQYGGIMPVIETKIDEKVPLAPPMREKKYIRRLIRFIISYI